MFVSDRQFPGRPNRVSHPTGIYKIRPEPYEIRSDPIRIHTNPTDSVGFSRKSGDGNTNGSLVA